MPRPKSVLASMEITIAGRAHDCRYNKNHRLEKGMSRLTIKDDGDEHHYCLSCARAFLLQGNERLRVLLSDVERLLG
ncbi:MAG TPA: hypothetical protein VFB23_05645 [Candidatus Acidoferrales bacterium]|nr:hypothetical protein [Candidatus Acidoferrales bacterium]